MVSPQGVHIGFGLRAALVAVNEAVREVESIERGVFWILHLPAWNQRGSFRYAPAGVLGPGS
jgi:hypothetical protein